MRRAPSTKRATRPFFGLFLTNKTIVNFTFHGIIFIFLRFSIPLIYIFFRFLTAEFCIFFRFSNRGEAIFSDQIATLGAFLPAFSAVSASVSAFFSLKRGIRMETVSP